VIEAIDKLPSHYNNQDNNVTFTITTIMPFTNADSESAQ
jgi:hypothetical protein